MDTVMLVLTMLLLVVVSGFLVRVIPRPLPLPLVQIGLGALITTVSDFHVDLDPHIFFLLFIPPLLFLDGWRIPKTGLFRDKGTILELALGLVIFTVIGLGFLIHWLIPSMPLGVAFILAAVLSPTDPIAVSAISARVPIPKRVMHILEGESLLNDASGLVCLRFATAAVMTGAFSITNAMATFIWLALGGIGVGVALTIGVGYIKNWLSSRWGEESGTQILISLLIPFGAYIIAEHMACSGILAAVAAGITMSYVEASGQAMASTRIRRNVVWDAVQFSANGVIFVLLGQQLPDLARGATTVITEAGHREAWWLVVYVIAILGSLAALRFIWVWLSVRFTMMRAHLRGEALQPMHWRMISVMSLSGVRGAITLAAALTIPLALPDGTPFPARDMVIFLAAAIIISSLILATVALPRLLHGLDIPQESHQEEEDFARMSAAKAAMQAIEKTQHEMAEGRTDADLYARAAIRVMELYRPHIEDKAVKTGEERDVIRQIDNIERYLHLAAIKAERSEILKLAKSRQVEDDMMRKLLREIDLVEARYL
ncbi:MAG: Na+/H+ antiporter [Pseudobdellovibrionaceae bacterium]|nr:Na+/H+ antiporter [Pseudobdellovibrionaceae bacterium]